MEHANTIQNINKATSSLYGYKLIITKSMTTSKTREDKTRRNSSKKDNM